MSYKGRHRKPTPYTSATHVALASAGALLVSPALATAAHADPPGGWGPIIECESGGDPRAQNPSSTASGLFQFIDSTWRSVGGEGRAKDASVDEQYKRANILYEQSGTTPWNASKSCWAGKAAEEPVIEEVKVEESIGTSSYTVKSGDTLSKIANKSGTTWELLFEINKGTISDPNLIYVSQVIVIKG